MGKEVRGIPEASPVGPAAEAAGGRAAVEHRSVGRYLAQQRRLRGISLDELELLTKIPRRSLERLEAGAFEGTPDGFARGFVRSVAVALGLDPHEAVMRLLREPPEEDLARAVLRAPLRRGVTAGVLLALAAAALGLWTWSAPADPPATEAAEVTAEGTAEITAEITAEGTVDSELIYRRDAVRSLLEPEPAGRRSAPGDGRIMDDSD